MREYHPNELDGDEIDAIARESQQVIREEERLREQGYE